jgi:hypothetical protein
VLQSGKSRSVTWIASLFFYLYDLVSSFMIVLFYHTGQIIDAEFCYLNCYVIHPTITLHMSILHQLCAELLD